MTQKSAQLHLKKIKKIARVGAVRQKSQITNASLDGYSLRAANIQNAKVVRCGSGLCKSDHS